MVEIGRQAGTETATDRVHAYVRRFLADFESSDEWFGEAAVKLLEGLFSHKDLREALVEIECAGGDVGAVVGVAKEGT